MPHPKDTPVMVCLMVYPYPGLPGKRVVVPVDELPDSINCYPTFSIVEPNLAYPTEKEGE